MHSLSLVLEARSGGLPFKFALNRRRSRRRRTRWDIIFSALLLQLVYDVDVVSR